MPRPKKPDSSRVNLNLPHDLQQQARLLGDGELTAGVEQAIAQAYYRVVLPKKRITFGDLSEGDWFVFLDSLPLSYPRLKIAEDKSWAIGQPSPDRAEPDWLVAYIRVS